MNAAKILVLLFGNIGYDGRVQRMIEILNRVGRVALIDVSSAPEGSDVPSTTDCRISLDLSKYPSQLRHIRFLGEAMRVARKLQPDVIVAEDYFTTLPGLAASVAARTLLIYDAHELIVPQPARPMNIRNRVWYLFEHLALMRAHLVIAANPDRARIMAEHYHLRTMPVTMLNIPSHRRPELVREHLFETYPALRPRGRSDIVLLYQGHISLPRGLGRFVEALRFLPASYRLVVAGGGPDLDGLRQAGESLASEGRLLLLGRVPNHLLSSVTAVADAGIVTYPYQGLNNIYCAPNKIFEYAQAGLAVIATDQPPLRRILDKYRIGALIRETDTPQTIALRIQETLREDPQAHASRITSFLSHHRWESEADRVETAVKSLVLPPSRRQ